MKNSVIERCSCFCSGNVPLSRLTEVINTSSQHADADHTHLVKSIDWKQGVIIAMGVPILILPSLYDISGIFWAFSIVIWVISVIQGFLQNFAIGEMSAALEVPGIGGCAQTIFYNDTSKKYSRGRFLGAFTAWSYWFTWTPVIPIFTLMTGEYLRSFIPALAGVNSVAMDLCLGIAIYMTIILVGRKGLAGGAKLGLILALLTLLPLVAISILSFFTSADMVEFGYTAKFSLSNITDNFLPNGHDFGNDAYNAHAYYDGIKAWTWSPVEIMLLFGAFAVAQWSACAWESAATYGAEYKDPGRNLPKALIGCGLVCLFIYFIVSFSVFGSLGMVGIEAEGYATLRGLAIADFGTVGSWIALFLLIAGMVMLIQTAFLGSSRTLFYMGSQGNLPEWFGETNDDNVPIHAEFFQMLMGLCLIPLGTPGMILAASSFGFSIALGMAMVCFIKFRREEKWAAIRDRREYIAPKGWYFVAWGLCIFQFCLLIPGCAVFSYYSYGISSVIVGAVILAVYIPIWLIMQNKNWKKYGGKAKEIEPMK